MKIAYIQAQWHKEVTDNCKTSFIGTWEKLGESKNDISFFEAPGSLEIPLLAKKLAMTNNYDAVCCSGFVVDGGIYRHEFVAQSILDGIMQVNLKTGVPVMSAVLTPKDEFKEDGSDPAQHQFFAEHMTIKGKELAQATHEIIKTLKSI